MLEPTTAEMTTTIGHRLRLVREARGLTPGDVAAACEVSRQAVSQWEADKYSPNIANLEKAAARLSVSLEWLRTGRGPPPNLRPIVPVAGRATEEPAAATAPKPMPPPVPPFPDMVPEQAMGIGSGPLLLDGRVHDWWKLPAGFVHETLRTSPPYLVVLRVLSDSMEPVIKLHDHVIIDRGDVMPVDGKIYAIDNGTSVILRRIFLAGDKVILRSDRDPDKDVIEIPRDDVRIIGRCVVAIVVT
jgi:phage repressor protein C with HTH and peptisase S24 domain